MKTRQEMFDQSLAGIRTQGEQSMRHKECVYRMERERDGKVLKCGVGQLIPDAIYNPDVEGVTPSNLYTGEDLDANGALDPRMPALREALVASGLSVSTADDCEFLSLLQGAHDWWSEHDGRGFIGDFEMRMAELASRYSLVYTPPGAQA